MGRSLPGLIGYFEAIQQIGPRVIANWSGDERAVPSVAEDWRVWLEIDSFDEERLRQEWAIRVQQTYTDAERQRAAGAPKSGDYEEMIRAATDNLAKSTDPTERDRLEQGIAFLRQRQQQPETVEPRSTEEWLEWIRAQLREERRAAESNNRARRERRNRVHAIIRGKVFSESLKAGIEYYRGEIVYPPLDKLKAGWPEAGDGTAAYLLDGLWPILLVEADLDREFPDGTGNENMPSKAPTMNGSEPPALGNGETDGVVNIGPPTVMHLIRQEMVRRAKERKAETETNLWPSWNSESKDLAQWARNNITDGRKVPVASTIRRDEGKFYGKLKSGWLPEHAGN